MSIPSIPALRFGAEYYSLEKVTLPDVSTGGAAAEAGLVNAGLIRRDVLQIARAREIATGVPIGEMIEICGRAAEYFLRAELPLGAGQPLQGASDYVRQLSATTGLPHALCRANMHKIQYVLANMRRILEGLTRGLELACLDAGIGEHNGVAVSFYPLTQALGIVLPSNSPGVNSLWLPAVALKTPVVIKPGREEPWTPLRIIRALIAAGCPPELFCFYPAGHDGAESILATCGRAIIFGDAATIERYANNPNVQAHGPGYSKIILGADQADDWEKHLDVMVDSVLRNGGRSCVNASAIVAPRHGRNIAEALAARLAAIQPAPLDATDAQLAGFANPAVADYIDNAIDEGLQEPGATDCTAALRNGPRKLDRDGCRYLLPTVIFCDDAEHPLANREFLFPYCSVLEIPQNEILEKIGPTLVCSAITEDATFIGQLLQSPRIERLNIGSISTMEINWAQPHEGNMFEFLYRRRAIQNPGMQSLESLRTG